jgi:hypothetical protein
LQRFRPEAAVGTCKADGAVHGLVAHGDVDLEAEAADEVLLLVAIEDDGVDDANGCLSPEEIEAHGEGEPFALRHGTAVHAFDPDHGADWTLLFHGDALDLAEKFLACGRVLRIVGWPFLQDANQFARSSDHLAVERDGIDEIAARGRDGALHRARVDGDGLCGICNLHSAAWYWLGADAAIQGERLLEAGRKYGSKPAPLNGAVGPVGERPTLHGQVAALCAQAET